MANEVNRRSRGSQSSSPTNDSSDGYSSDGDVHSLCDAIGRSLSYSSQESLITAVDKTRKSDTTMSEECLLKLDNNYNNLKDVSNMLRFDPRQKDYEKIFDEKLQQPYPGKSSLFEWNPNVTVITVNMYGKQPSFEKHNERIVPNQWRRVGPCMKLHSIGGHVTAGKRRSQLKEVKKGTPPPKAPAVPEFTLHRDENPKGSRIPIPFDMPGKNVPGYVAARVLAGQMQDRVISAWKKESWFDLKDKTNQNSGNVTKKPLTTSKYSSINQQQQKKCDSSSMSSSTTTDSLKTKMVTTSKMSSKKR